MNDDPDSMALEKQGGFLAPFGALIGALRGAVVCLDGAQHDRLHGGRRGAADCMTGVQGV